MQNVNEGDEGGWSGSTYFYIKIYFIGLSVRLTIWTRARKMFSKHTFIYIYIYIYIVVLVCFYFNI